MKLQAFSAMTVSLASAQSIIEGASFGHTGGNISPNRYAIPAWHISGSNDWTPELLSDKIILTPPYPGNKRGAIWTDTPIHDHTWTADVEFRATGPEHGGGNLQIWYTREGQDQIGTSNVHTVHTFEGLVIVLDMHGGTGGMVRGFLNDGSIDFVNHHHLESLAFGHCGYSYRNLGRPSKITMKQDTTGFEVQVDGQRCFRSDDILLPSDHYFGLTSTSSETPDSFEVFKFATSIIPGQQQYQQPAGGQQQNQPPPNQYQQNQPRRDYNLQDVLASTLRNQQDQFEDIHNRVQAIAHQVDTAIQEIHRTTSNVQGRMEELHHSLARQSSLDVLATRIQNLENQLNSVRNDQRDWTGHFNDIHSALKVRHDALLNVLPENMSNVLASKAPNIKLFVFLVLGFQAMLAAAYVVYKRRLNQGPKKYL
ncbi:MAG: hypothetical protein MMC23_007310 [Stictis urceolatum]|nr:hypothetical protein [Stictis urceolata]